MMAGVVANGHFAKGCASQVGLECSIAVAHPITTRTALSKPAAIAGNTVTPKRLPGPGRVAVSLAFLAPLMWLPQAGLAARGLGEEAHLAPLMESLASGKTQADRYLAAWEGEWQGSLAPLYRAAAL